ncbi:MAG TPA: SH3 domain-containing protein [Thermoanaerobaculia bacterium]|nr:SH3 domain-containing protein [Thermoanaerobaculia bacterium]
MRRSLPVLLFLTLACRENVAPESVTTTTNDATASTTAPAPAAPVPPAAPPVATSTAPGVNGPKLMPVDDAPQDAALVAYRNQLLDAVRRRDAAAVAALVDPKIRTSFGNGGGTDEFRKTLAKEGVLEDLALVLSRGGTFQGEGESRSFWAPYVYSAWPDRHDAFESLAVIEDNVPLRETKDAASPVVATLAYDIVTLVISEEELRQVKTADGKVGWVDARHVRSPVGYRAGFNKTGGQWLMNAFVAGD